MQKNIAKNVSKGLLTVFLAVLFVGTLVSPAFSHRVRTRHYSPGVHIHTGAYRSGYVVVRPAVTTIHRYHPHHGYGCRVVKGSWYHPSYGRHVHTGAGCRVHIVH